MTDCYKYCIPDESLEIADIAKTIQTVFSNFRT